MRFFLALLTLCSLTGFAQAQGYGKADYPRTDYKRDVRGGRQLTPNTYPNIPNIQRTQGIQQSLQFPVQAGQTITLNLRGMPFTGVIQRKYYSQDGTPMLLVTSATPGQESQFQQRVNSLVGSNIQVTFGNGEQFSSPLLAANWFPSDTDGGDGDGGGAAFFIPLWVVGELLLAGIGLVWSHL